MIGSMSALYSAEDVAELLGLHVRTVRGYVRDGRLPAVRIGKQYRIAAEDVDALTGGRTAAARPEPAATSPRVEVSAIVQLDGVDRSTVDRLTTLVTAAAGGRSGGARLHVQTVYDPHRHSLKIVAIGSPGDTAALVGLVGTFTDSEL
ncbi:DNA binding domain-containing protein, excisionase family [Jiangella alkaliphila]|uniref:DNA binding domain-containing protein, excisionase family n=2 Tax=Jiangella alkaliphila TaxID=419479 RepID=A0A1H2KL36_9ACTN|nr:DNA binding domain-containing protein, excisionase family [Jiangella alkaliphila]